jgi:hypothetical protein
MATVVTKLMSKKYTCQGIFGAIIEPQTLKETDELRRDIPRSRWIERTLIMYNGYVKEELTQDDARGSHEVTSQSSTTPTPVTPGPEKPTPLLTSGGLRVDS